MKRMKTLTAKQAMATLGVETSRAYELIKAPFDMPHIRLEEGGELRFIESSVIAWKPVYEKILADTKAGIAGKMTSSQVAELLGLKSTSAVYGLITSHNLPCRKEPCGKVYRYVFDRDAVMEWKVAFDEREKVRQANEMTTKEVAELLSFSVSKIYELVRHKGLPCEMVPHGKTIRYRFREDAVVAWFIGQEVNMLPAETELEGMMEAMPPGTPEAPPDRPGTPEVARPRPAAGDTAG